MQRLNLGFYAGTALRTAQGYSIGVLCVIDYKPRPFSAEEAVLLERLAAVVMSLLDLRLQLLQQPTWNQQLWASIYARIEASVTRLETLASLASWEENADSEAAQSYRRSTQDETLHVIEVLHEQIRLQAQPA